MVDRHARRSLAPSGTDHLTHPMATRLERPLKREIDVGGKPYILTVSPEGLKLVEKGRRKGQELTWRALVSGEAALAVALNASLEQAR